MGTNTGIGIGIGIPFRNNALGGDNIYFPPELKARMIGVWDNYGKKNTDADRNIIKNKIPNAGGDLEILNSAYKLNSGFGEYREDFTSWIVSKEPMTVEKTDSQVHISYIGTSYKELPMFEYSGPINENYSLTVEIQGIPNNVIGKFIHNNGFIQEVTNGINTIKFSNSGSWYGFTFYREDNTIIGDCDITIKQIPAFEGALVTDGINDIIASIKTLEDWNVGNKGITIISMIHQITTNKNFTTTNNLRNEGRVVGRNVVSNTGKTGIYGWYKKDLQGKTATLISNILGDKNDYTGHYTENTNPITNSKFYVQGYAVENGFTELSSVAHYWTFAVLGKATEDEINLIIAKYNLDRTLRPDIYCNIAKQGITNDNHADFNDRLIDYSGNGRDIQMYNLAWKGGSGVAAKKFETIKDYLIVPDKGLQELTIYNEFSYKVKSIKYADRYWTIQTLNKTDVSYPITIVSDKNIIWRNAINYTDENGVKRSIRKETNVPANTPTQVFILGFNDFDVPDNYTKVNCVAYATRTDITEFTVTFIPSCKGGILLDGIEDFGKVTGMSIYKDYTFIIDRKFLNETFTNQVCLASKSKVAVEGENGGAFIVDNISVNSIINPYSFYKTTSLPGLNTFDKQIVFQTKYKYLGKDIAAGTATDSDTLWLGTFRDNDSRFANVAIYSLMSFPYSMSEFLIERQLKKHKLGTLYPDMVEFRPVIKANANYNIFYTALLPLTGIVWEKINIGDYIPVGRRVAIQLSFDNEASELVSAISSQLGNISITKNSNNKGYTIFGDILKNKSPQKINITIDEYIRYEDIVQPYPVLLRFNDENGNEVSWGDKFRVGSTITRIGSAADSNLLPNIYNIFGLLLNDNQVTSSKVIVEKTMVFKAKSAYIFDNNEPKCILSPRLLRIPNSSYKILGYIPDISGHGNHGVIHNSAYAEGSGVNEDGSYQFDGVNDHVTIPTVTGGGKQVFMKINNNDDRLGRMIYDQRSPSSGTGLYSDFAIYTNEDTTSSIIAYQSRLSGNTYIDGILNTNITCKDLQGVLQNITITCDIVKPNNGVVPYIGTGGYDKNIYGKFALYDYILFDNISTDDKIKELNEYVGIEAKVEKMPYYWDAYGKTNLDVDRGIVPQLGIAKDYSFASFDNEMAWYLIPNDNYINVVSRNGYEITLKNLSTGVNGWRFQNSTVKGFISHDIPFRIKANKSIRVYWDMHSYKISTGAEFGEVISITNVSPNKDTYINLRHLTEEELAKLDTNKDRMYYLLWFDLSTIAVNEEVVIEMLPVEGGRNLWLNNYNFAYDKMSGFGGYEFDKFTNTSRWIETKRENGIEVIEKNDYSFTAKRVGTGEYFWDFKNNTIRTLDKELTVKAVSNNNVSIKWEFKYRTAEKPDIDSAIVLVKQVMTPNVPITVTLPYKTEEEQAELGVIEGSTYYLFYFDPSDIPVNEEYTVEMLPLYPNGLVYDGVTDYSENANIPIFDDFTFLVKASLPNGFTGSGGAIAKKGSNTQVIGGGYDFVYALDSSTTEANRNSYWSFGKALLPSTGAIDPPLIGYMTKTDVNGIPTTAGTNPSIEGITFSRWAGHISMIFYKAILYPKTIPLLQINFLKNLMERDEIIDLNNPIFKNESNAL